ncbi:MAG: hypothetical protein K2X66_11315 [Cyanobacteria bacterium]|nr:hypothetical protein [Cyanobacteriota bacterium]
MARSNKKLDTQAMGDNQPEILENQNLNPQILTVPEALASGLISNDILRPLLCLEDLAENISAPMLNEMIVENHQGIETMYESLENVLIPVSQSSRNTLDKVDWPTFIKRHPHPKSMLKSKSSGIRLNDWVNLSRQFSKAQHTNLNKSTNLEADTLLSDCRKAYPHYETVFFGETDLDIRMLSTQGVILPPG